METSLKKNQIRVGNFFGIPVTFDFSWFLIVIVLAWILAVGYFPKEYKGWTEIQYWGVSIVTSVFFFLSVVLHEYGHSIVAKKYNYEVKGIKLFIFGGVSEIAVEPKNPKEEFLISIAGPVVSLLLGGIFYYAATVFNDKGMIYAFAHYLGWINIILGVFNLLPGFPLDGGRIFRAIVWGITKDYKKATHWSATAGRFIGFSLIFIGLMEMMAGFVTDGIWVALIGWFLESAAFAQLQQQELKKLLSGHKVADAYSRNYMLVPDDITILEFFDGNDFYRNRSFFFAENNGEITGVFTLQDLLSVPKTEWENVKISDIIIPISDTIKTTPDTPLADSLKIMDENSFNQLPVFENGKLIGVLSRKSLVAYLSQMNTHAKR